MKNSRYIVDEVAVKKELDKNPNWTATCQLCGEVLQGTPAELKAHVCKHDAH